MVVVPLGKSAQACEVYFLVRWNVIIYSRVEGFICAWVGSLSQANKQSRGGVGSKTAAPNPVPFVESIGS